MHGGTRASKRVLIHDLQETLVRLIYDRWPGLQLDEDPPFTFTVPCSTPDCRGKYALNVLRAEREAQQEGAFCDARRPHSHPVAKLLYGIELPTTLAETRKLELASRTYGMPPRLLEISAALQKNLNAVENLTKERIQIQVYCELSENWFLAQSMLLRSTRNGLPNSGDGCPGSQGISIFCKGPSRRSG